MLNEVVNNANNVEAYKSKLHQSNRKLTVSVSYRVLIGQCIFQKIFLFDYFVGSNVRSIS